MQDLPKLFLIVVAMAAVFCASLSGVAARTDMVVYDQIRDFFTPAAEEIPPADSVSSKAAAKAADAPAPRIGAALIAVPFYIAGRIADHFVRNGDGTAQGFTPLITLISSVFIVTACAVLIFFICLEIGCRPKTSRLAMLSFAFCSLAFPAAGRFGETQIAALTILLFLFTYFRLRSGFDNILHDLGLGLSLGLCLVAHKYTILFFPFFLLLALLNATKIFKDKWKPLYIFLPLLLGLILLFLNEKTRGGFADFNTWTASLYTPDPRPFNGRDELIAALGGYRGLESLRWIPHARPIERVGFLVAMPQLVFAFFGILNLWSESLTRRPLYVLLLTLVGWFFLATTNPASFGADYDLHDLFPVVALLFVLLGSFIDYHLMTMRGIILKPLFRLAFLLLTWVGFVNAASSVMTRSYLHQDIPRLFRIFHTAAQVPIEHQSAEGFASLLFPSLPNLPVFLPIAAFFLGVPFGLHWLTVGRKMKKVLAQSRAMRSEKPQPPPRKEPRTDKEKYEAILEKEEKKEEPVKKAEKEEKPAFPVWGSKDKKDDDNGDGWVH